VRQKYPELAAVFVGLGVVGERIHCRRHRRRPKKCMPRFVSIVTVRPKVRAELRTSIAAVVVAF